MSGYEFDIDELREPAPEQLGELTGLAESLADQYAGIANERSNASVVFGFEDDEDPNRVFPSKLDIDQTDDETSVILFSNSEVGALLSLRLPHNGPPVLTDNDPQLTQGVLDDEVIEAISLDESLPSKTAAAIFRALKIVTQRINTARQAGVELNDEYSGPVIEPNPDGSINGDQFEAFVDGLPKHELDGLLASDTEISLIREIVEEYLKTEPTVLSAGNGSFSHTFKDGSKLRLHHLSATVEDPLTQLQVNSEFDATGMSRVSVDYDDGETDLSLYIPFGDIPPHLVIASKSLRAIAVRSLVENGELPEEFSDTTPNGLLSFSFQSPDPVIMAQYAVEMAELQANTPTAGKVEKAIKILDTVRKKLEAESIAGQ